MGFKLTDPNKAIWNPVKRYPRNAPCVCGSGKKFKKCCEPHQPVAINNEGEQTQKENADIATFVNLVRKHQAK